MGDDVVSEQNGGLREPGTGLGRIAKRRARRHRLKLVALSDVDQRSFAVRFTRSLMVAMEADLGGIDNMTTMQRQLVQRAAILGVMCEDAESRFAAGEEIDRPGYMAAVNTQRRVLQALGLERRARDVQPSMSVLEYAQAVKSEHEASTRPVIDVEADNG